MAYNATYTADDTAPAVIDTLVKVVAVFGSLGTIVGLVLLYGWLKKKL